MKTCPSCGGQSSPRSQYCYHCGAPLTEVVVPATVPQEPLPAAPPQDDVPALPASPAATVDDPALGVAGDGKGGKVDPTTAPTELPGPGASPDSDRADGGGGHTVPPGWVVDGKYLIERVLGEGGMGVVYLARDQHTGVEVVLKAVRPEIAHRKDVRERTLHEGRALARIDHANVVQLKAVVADEDELWLVMQYIEGESLEDAIEHHNRRGTSLSLADALELFRQVVAGVSAAHAEGLIHRDLKPQNILIRSKDQVVKVSDFGIAKVEEDALAGRGQTTGFIGSPHYTSPEQITGRKDLDRRVDIYALGILLYTMLAGRVPFDGESTFAVMKLHMEAPMPSVRGARPDLPAGIDDVLQRACAKQREQRFGSCEELLGALEALVPPQQALTAAQPAAPPPATQPAMPAVPAMPYAGPSAAPLGTVTGHASVLPQPPASSGRSWIVALVGLLVLVGAIGALVVVVIDPFDRSAADPSPPTAEPPATVPPPATTSTVQAPASPLAVLEGVWKSDSGREMKAVLVGETVEFRVVDATQFAPQDYREGEPRFVLHRLEERSDTFEVEDRIRPRPPAGHRWDPAQARTTCYAVWRSARGKPLRAVLSGDRLNVDFAKIEPTLAHFVVVDETVVSCRGLEKLRATRIPVVLHRQSDDGGRSSSGSVQ